MADNSNSNSNNDFEIGDVENFGGKKDEQFSHSSLVMSAMRRVTDAGSKELRPGWFNTRKDSQGHIIQTYIEDTRKVFIESVKTCMMVMSCDADENSRNNIGELLSRIEDKRKELVELNNKSWDELSPIEKINYTKAGERHIHGKISHKILIDELVEFELEIYREIFCELTDLTKRLDFYKAEIFEN